MLLEKSSQKIQNPTTPCNESESESLHVDIPQLAEFNPALSPLRFVASPIDWFGTETTFNTYHHSSNNVSGPSPFTSVTPRNRSWDHQSFGSGSGTDFVNYYSPRSTKMRFPSSRPHQTMRQVWSDCGLSQDGNPCSSDEESKYTDAWCKKNIHPGRDTWVADVSCDSDSFTGDTHEIQTRESEYLKSEYNKTLSWKQRYINKEFVHRPDKITGGEEDLRMNKFGICLRKRYRSRISRKDLKLFAKAIGYQRFGNGIHYNTFEILDYIIDSKLVYRSCTCRRGSMFLQYHIMNANWANLNGILEQVMEKLIAICNEKYGNHVVQSFFQVNNQDIERKIVLRMNTSIRALAMNQYGSRVLQRAILLINDELLRSVMDAIAPNACMLAVNDSGHHVLQRAIERGSGEFVQMLLVNFKGGRRNNSLIKLSKDSFGCRVVQRMLESAHPRDRGVIIGAIMSSSRDLLALCEDKYGNYIVQHILNHFPQQYSMMLMDMLDDQLFKMAKNKFCSYILEVLYKRGGRNVENRMIKQVNRKLLKDFLNDQFAHYLVQTMLTEGAPENQVKIQRLLLTIPRLPKLKYGKFVINRL